MADLGACPMPDWVETTEICIGLEDMIQVCAFEGKLTANLERII